MRVDFSSPLRSIAPGLDSAVLQVLAGTHSGLSASQIARLAPRGSRTGLLPVLDRLVVHGLVVAEPANLGHLYRLNREHVLASAVLAAVAARGAVLERLKNAVEELGPGLVHASVFGSFARADGGADSDIDLLLVTENDEDDAWIEQRQQLARSVLAWTGNRLETLHLPSERLAGAVRAEEPIIASLLADAVTLYGPSVDGLVQAASVAPAGEGRRR